MKKQKPLLKEKTPTEGELKITYYIIYTKFYNVNTELKLVKKTALLKEGQLLMILIIILIIIQHLHFFRYSLQYR